MISVGPPGCFAPAALEIAEEQRGFRHVEAARQIARRRLDQHFLNRSRFSDAVLRPDICAKSRHRGIGPVPEAKCGRRIASAASNRPWAIRTRASRSSATMSMIALRVGLIGHRTRVRSENATRNNCFTWRRISRGTSSLLCRPMAASGLRASMTRRDLLNPDEGLFQAWGQTYADWPSATGSNMEPWSRAAVDAADALGAGSDFRLAGILSRLSTRRLSPMSTAPASIRSDT